MKKLLVLIAAVAALVVLAVPASATGAGATSTTVTFTDVPFGPFPAGRCAPVGSLVSGNESGVFHITTLANGTFWATGTVTGKAVIVTPAAVSYTGPFAIWFGDNNNLNNGAETSIFEAQLKASDGSTIDIHAVAHLSVSASVPPQVNMFFDFSC